MNFKKKSTWAHLGVGVVIPLCKLCVWILMAHSNTQRFKHTSLEQLPETTGGLWRLRGKTIHHSSFSTCLPSIFSPNFCTCLHFLLFTSWDFDLFIYLFYFQPMSELQRNLSGKKCHFLDWPVTNWPANQSRTRDSYQPQYVSRVSKGNSKWAFLILGRFLVL